VPDSRVSLHRVADCAGAICHETAKASASMLVCSSLQHLFYLFVDHCSAEVRAHVVHGARVSEGFPNERSRRVIANRARHIIHFLYTGEAASQRNAANAADIDFSFRRFRIHFSRCAAGGGVKCISRSRPDKKRICMPAICNPSVGCREIDGTGTRIYRS